MLKIVTITGADDSIEPCELITLSEEFPFVEWGILMSKSRVYTPRYPSYDWMDELKFSSWFGRYAKLSAHICGEWTRDLFSDDREKWSSMWKLPLLLTWARRVQFNIPVSNVTVHDGCLEMLEMLNLRHPRHYGKECIFQNSLPMDSSGGLSAFDCCVLFDGSAGNGRLPHEWPSSVTGTKEPFCGYAGGLSPDNLAVELPKIESAAKGMRYWIDMETGVRTDDGKSFDLAKVRKCLLIAKEHIRPTDQAEKQTNADH